MEIDSTPVIDRIGKGKCHEDFPFVDIGNRDNDVGWKNPIYLLKLFLSCHFFEFLFIQMSRLDVCFKHTSKEDRKSLQTMSFEYFFICLTEKVISWKYNEEVGNLR